MPLVPTDPQEAAARAQWEDHRDFIAAEDATSVMCASCGEVVEIPMELRGGPKVHPYLCDVCKDVDTSGTEYRERMYGPEDYGPWVQQDWEDELPQGARYIGDE